MDNSNRPDENAPGVSASELANELRALGQNLKEVLRAAWESEERKKFQQEIEAGLKDLGDTVNEVATDFRQSPTAQRIREDVGDFHQRVRTGEVETKVRSEVLSALRTVNAELEKAANRKKNAGQSGSQNDSKPS